TIDYVNPEAPWPKLADLERRTAERGYELRERLAIYPGYALRPDPWIAGKMHDPVRRLTGPDGLADALHPSPEPVPWQDPEVVWKPRTTGLAFAKGLDAGLRIDAEDVYGTFEEVEATRAWTLERARRSPERLRAGVRAALSKASNGRGGELSDAEAVALFEA